MQINMAFPVPAPDIAALLQGRAIAFLPRIFINPGKVFALYPANVGDLALPLEQFYRPSFLDLARQSLAAPDATTVELTGWVKCDRCEIIEQNDNLERLSQLTVWTRDALQATIDQRGRLFLAYVRAYRFPTPQTIPSQTRRRYLPLPNAIAVPEDPVLGDTSFARRCDQLARLEPPTYPELEELLSAISPHAQRHPAAETLEKDIQCLLGWNSSGNSQRLDSDLVWIEKIASVGNSSDGNEFERLVRKSLTKLGFSCTQPTPKANLNPEDVGGAGGLDFYGDRPYPIVGECKASKHEKVPDGTPAQLIKLGNNHLPGTYDSCLKLIFAAGELTQAALLTATNNQINIMRPETLQALVEMQARYPGAIDLLKLRDCCQSDYGLADDRIEEYLATLRQQIKVRSRLVGIVKSYLENTQQTAVGVEALHGAYVTSNPTQTLSVEEMHELLIELASPLCGYLGRQKGGHWRRDRFYFLRELP